MDGFKNTTKMKYMGAGGMVDGYSMGGYAKGGNAKPMMKGGDAKPMMAKGGNAKVGAKISKVMGEFKKGDLHSGSKDGPKVKSPKQAMAIALSEAGKGKGKMPMKKNEGGKIGKMPPLGESVKSGNRMSKMTAAEMRAMEERFGNKRRPSPGDSVKSGNRIAKEEADEARHLGVFKNGGKVRKYAEGGAVEVVRKRALPAFDASAAYQKFGADLKGMIDSGQLTLEQANALKAPAFEATRLRDVGQQQQAMDAALAGVRGRMESMIPTAPRGLSVLALEGLKNESIMKEPLPMMELPRGVGASQPQMKPPLMMERPTPPPMQKIYEPRRPPHYDPYLPDRAQPPVDPGFVIGPRDRPSVMPTPDGGFAAAIGGELNNLRPTKGPDGGMGLLGQRQPRMPEKNVTMMKHGGRTAMPKGKR